METKSNYATPIAIVIAGVVIAGAMYFSDGPKTEAPVLTKPVINSIDQMKLVSAEDHIRGNPNAEITIIEYSDTECPFCKRFHTSMQGIIDTYGKDGQVAWVYRHFPLDGLHSKTRKEAEATECAGELGGDESFWKYIDLVYTNTPANNGLDLAKLPEFAKSIGLDGAKFEQCLASGKYADKVGADLQSGIKIGIQGTPYSVMVLKEILADEIKGEINDYVVKNKIYDRSGQPLVFVSSDKKMVAMNGALPLEMIKDIINLILN